MQHALPDHLTGSLLEGRYELGPRIARGGTATVYRAVDTRLERTVAVKLLHPHLAEDAAAAERFVREARAAARLSHPHVVSVLDQGHAPDGVPYLVMEHVEGSTLRDLLRRRGALAPGEALEVMDAVLDGLAAAHRAGLVHRDVKPENVLIAAGGRVTVADFGLTRAVDQHTATGTVLGTVGYASPELVTGERVDTRADVYSAGIVLFELLCGRRPFEGGPIAVARAHAERRVPDVRSLAPGVPPALAHLVARATARAPQDRPADAAELLALLREVRAGLRPEELDRGPARSGAAPWPRSDRTEVLAPRPSATGTTGRTGTATEVLRPAATQVLRPAATAALPGAATEVLPGAGRRPGAPDRRAGAASGEPPGPGALSRGSSDPWRPEIELRPVRPLRTAAHLALVALAVAAAAFLGWLTGSGPGGPVSVPEVRGTGPELARQYLAGAGLGNVAVHETPDALAPAGTVVGTDPGAAAAVRPAEQVVLFVSTGPQLTTAPDVVGMAAGDASARLADAGLSAGERTAVPDEEPAGTVVGQHPDAGTDVVTGSAVELAVSDGPRAAAAPRVVGRPVDQAARVLEEAGFTARVEERLGAPLGYVLSQTTEVAEVVLTVL